MDPLLVKAVVAFAGGFALWGVKQLFDFFLRWRQSVLKQRNLVRSLFAEIDFNTRDMEVFLKNSASVERVKRALEMKPDLVPHVTDARHTEIYRLRMGELHEIPDRVLQRTIHFYGLLEKIKVQIDGVYRPNYKTLTVSGQADVIDLIRHTAEQARDCGADLMFEFRMNYPKMGLKRHKRL